MSDVYEKESQNKFYGAGSWYLVGPENELTEKFKIVEKKITMLKDGTVRLDAIIDKNYRLEECL